MELYRTMPNDLTPMCKNIIIIISSTLYTCLSSCDVTVEQNKASDYITNHITNIVSHKLSQDGIDLSKQDSTLINNQVKNIISRLQTRENTTDSTYTLSYDEIAYFALIIYHHSLCQQLATIDSTNGQRSELEEKRISIENQLNRCNVHVMPIENYDVVEQFLKQYLPSNTLYWPFSTD